MIELDDTSPSPIDTTPRPWETQEPFKIVPVLRGADRIAYLHGRYERRAHIAGGYVRYMASPNVTPVPAGDVDLFPLTQKDYAIIVGDLQAHGLKIKNESEVALSFWPTETGVFASTPPIQVVKPENKGRIVATGTLMDVLSNFDLTVVRAGLRSLQFALVDKDFYKDEAEGTIRLKNIHCPVSAVVRIAKYAKKGYRIDLAEILKLYADWDDRSPTYKRDLITAVGIMSDPQLRENLTDEEIAKYRHLIYID